MPMMPVIRILFRSIGCDVAAYSDEQVADAMLEVCPRLDDFWLTTKHLQQTFSKLNSTGA